MRTWFARIIPCSRKRTCSDRWSHFSPLNCTTGSSFSSVAWETKVGIWSFKTKRTNRSKSPFRMYFRFGAVPLIKRTNSCWIFSTHAIRGCGCRKPRKRMISASKCSPPVDLVKGPTRGNWEVNSPWLWLICWGINRRSRLWNRPHSSLAKGSRFTTFSNYLCTLRTPLKWTNGRKIKLSFPNNIIIKLCYRTV